MDAARAGDEEITDAEAKRLGRLWRREGPAALPHVMDTLCAPSSDHFVRTRAKDELVHIGPSAVEALFARSDDLQCDADLKGDILPHVVCTSKGAPHATLRPLLSRLDGREEGQAVMALEVVARASVYDHCAAWPALRKLAAGPGVKLLDRVSVSRKAEVLSHLTSLGPAGASAVPRATALLETPTFRAPAATLLGYIGPASAPAVPRLIQIVETTNDPAAIEALGMIKGPARAAVPKLLSLLSTAAQAGCQRQPVPPHILVGAITSLAEGAEGKGATPAAVEGLTSARKLCPGLRTMITASLQRLGAS